RRPPSRLAAAAFDRGRPRRHQDDCERGAYGPRVRPTGCVRCGPPAVENEKTCPCRGNDDMRVEQNPMGGRCAEDEDLDPQGEAGTRDCDTCGHERARLKPATT